jgi:hypothetical protein
MKITKTLPKLNKSVTVEFNMPVSLADKVKAFGEEVVNSHAQGSMVIWIQSNIARWMVKGLTQAQMDDAAKNLKPGVSLRSPKVDTDAEILAFVQMTPEQQKKKIQEMKERLAAKEAAAKVSATAAK